jgi:hypothetical protein
MVTDSGGDASATVVGVGFGRLVGVLYNGGLDEGATITVKDVKSTATVLAYTTGTEGTAVFFRPTGVITVNAGTAVSAHATAPNVNRDKFLSGKVSVTVLSGGNVETGILSLIVDETGIGDPAQTI